MLKFLSKKMKKNISTISLVCFIFSPLSYLHMNVLEAAPPSLPNQVEQQVSQKKPPTKKPNVNRPKPSTNRPVSKPNMNRPKPSTNRPVPKPNVNRPKPSINGPVSKPDNKFKPPMAKPGPRPDNKFKPPMAKPEPRPDNKFKPPMAKPGPRPDNKFKPSMVKPGPRPDNKFKRPIANKTIQNFRMATSLESNEDVRDDKPSLWERILAGVLFTRMSFIQDSAKLSSELNDMGFNCMGLDINYPDKYVQIYCNNYINSNNNHIDYYLDKTSLSVLKYNPPYYVIKVNEITVDENNVADKQLNTWEFKYNIDTKMVEFKNLYGSYHYKYKNSNYLDIYTTESEIVAMAEMAFYMAYNIRFFNNELESFYNVETL